VVVVAVAAVTVMGNHQILTEVQQEAGLVLHIAPDMA
jgi:hypothetical protein